MTGPNDWARPVSVHASAVVTLEDGATVELETVELDLREVNEFGPTKLVHGFEHPEMKHVDERFDLTRFIHQGPTYVTLDFAAKALDQSSNELYRLTWRPKPELAWTEGDVVIGDYTYVRGELGWQPYCKANVTGRVFSDDHMDYLLRTRKDELRVVRRGGEYR